jgi:hypothetical protein
VSGTSAAWLDAVANVVQRSADGEIDDASAAAGRVICVALISGGVTVNRTLSGSAVSYTANPCFNDGRPLTEARVQVIASRTSDLEALVFTRRLTLQSGAVSRYEAG